MQELTERVIWNMSYKHNGWVLLVQNKASCVTSLMKADSPSSIIFFFFFSFFLSFLIPGLDLIHSRGGEWQVNQVWSRNFKGIKETAEGGGLPSEHRGKRNLSCFTSKALKCNIQPQVCLLCFSTVNSHIKPLTSSRNQNKNNRKVFFNQIYLN